MKTILIIILLASSDLFSQSTHYELTNEIANEFINAIVNNSDSLDDFVFPEELTISKRLGIIYEGIKNKFLISYEIPDLIMEEMKSKKRFTPTILKKLTANIPFFIWK